jgi:hypothetical protein
MLVVFVDVRGPFVYVDVEMIFYDLSFMEQNSFASS